MSAPYPRLTAWLLLAMLIASLALPLSAPAAENIGDSISSARYIVADVETGEIYAHQSDHESVPIASLTKVFTFVEAIERAPLNTLITTAEADLVPESATQMGFSPGVTYTLEDLLYGMMLPSGNDAANAIARSLGAQPGDTPQQSVDRFVGWMNERIANMGLTETNLVNPSGWGVPGHHSSAHDVAAFVRYAMEYPIFRQVISTKYYSTSTTGFTVDNNNKILGTDPELIGGKTGYDDDAGWCLIEVWERGSSRMVAVNLDGVAPDVWYADNSILADYGFRMKAAGNGLGEFAAFKDPDAADIQSFAKPGALFSVDPPTPTAVPVASPAATPGVGITNTETNDGGSGPWLWIGVLVVVLAAAGGVAWVLFYRSKPTGKKSASVARKPGEAKLPPVKKSP